MQPLVPRRRARTPSRFLNPGLGSGDRDRFPKCLGVGWVRVRLGRGAWWGAAVQFDVFDIPAKAVWVWILAFARQITPPIRRSVPTRERKRYIVVLLTVYWQR